MQRACGPRGRCARMPSPRCADPSLAAALVAHHARRRRRRHRPGHRPLCPVQRRLLHRARGPCQAPRGAAAGSSRRVDRRQSAAAPLVLKQPKRLGNFAVPAIVIRPQSHLGELHADQNLVWLTNASQPRARRSAHLSHSTNTATCLLRAGIDSHQINISYIQQPLGSPGP